MVRIAADGDDVLILLDAKEKFLAVRRKISIPKKNIVSVSMEKVKPAWLTFKIGTHVPRVFMAGTFWTRGCKSFYYVRDFSSASPCTSRITNIPRRSSKWWGQGSRRKRAEKGAVAIPYRLRA